MGRGGTSLAKPLYMESVPGRYRGGVPGATAAGACTSLPDKPGWYQGRRIAAVALHLPAHDCKMSLPTLLLHASAWLNNRGLAAPSRVQVSPEE